MSSTAVATTVPYTLKKRFHTMQNLSKKHKSNITYATLQNSSEEKPKTFEVEFKTALKHSNATQNVYFSNYFDWQGQTRERWFIECIAKDLLQSEGVFITAKAHNQFFEEAYPFQTIQCKVNSFNIKKTSFSLRFSFYINGRLSSEGYQTLCFAGHDKQLKKLPETILQKVRQYEVADWIPQDTPVRLPPVTLNPNLPPLNQRYSTTFRTTLKHSNATQNVYFSNYFDWQGEAREQWLYDMIDETLLNKDGIFITAIAHNDFKKEAFPFQEVRCEIHTFNTQRCAFYLGFEFFHGSEVISKGYQKLIFINKKRRPARLPEHILGKIRLFEKV
jgi:enediyne biosynthesis thioesterase